MIKVSVLLLTLFCAVSQAQENRSITGYGNNLQQPEWGSTDAPLLRVSTTNYADGVQAMAQEGRPSPRVISNSLFKQSTSVANTNSLSDFVWLFGQFIDHDISMVDVNTESNPVIMEVPSDDEHFGQDDELSAYRDNEIENTGTQGKPRQFANAVTSFIDGSMIYGSTVQRASWLRTFENGKLWVSKNGPAGTEDLLPWNTTTKEYGGGSFIDNNAPAMTAGGNSKYFVCGDERANENPQLLSLHTVFVREHNRLCDELIETYPEWTDEQLYQRARKMIGAYLQSITFNEWLPATGINIPEYRGYQEKDTVGVMNVFSAAAFKIGHTMIDSEIIRMDNEGEIIPAGNLSFSEGYYQPLEIFNSLGIEPYLKGMGTQVMQEMDCKMVDDLRNFLNDGQNRGLDMAAFNIFRGRDRGLADYNTLRDDFGLAPLNAFDNLTDRSEDVEIIKELYQGDINKIDAWVGMLSEQHVSEKAIFGELVMTILYEQFRLLRDGDRFYFENDPAFTEEQISTIKNTSLHDILMRNTSINLMQSNVFSAMSHSDIPNLEVTAEELANIVYPNPVIDDATVRVYSENEQTISYKLFNHQGLDLQSGTVDLKSGDNNFMSLPMGEYPDGIYFLLLEFESLFEVTKIVK